MATNQNIDIANSWVTEEMSYEGDQINFNLKLIIIRSLNKTLELNPNLSILIKKQIFQLLMIEITKTKIQITIFQRLGILIR